MAWEGLEEIEGSRGVCREWRQKFRTELNYGLGGWLRGEGLHENMQCWEGEIVWVCDRLLLRDGIM